MAVAAQPVELLAPAGDWDCVRAAIENGADAVYFGLDTGFNARARAANFPLEDLDRLMATLHSRGVKGYVTLNTLVFSSELEAFESVVRTVATAGVDAVLVQDIGAAILVRAICPDLPVHASTQMTMTSAETIALAESLGCERVVLARELSLDEIRQIRAKSSMPLEVFVHGALCVAYSGQCLTSESFGGRSANRGQCAQACRLPYELVCDGKDVPLEAQKYLLSPQDLAAFDLLPALVDLGVSSLKIEGRLKAPEYVANITAHYRKALDAALAGSAVRFDAAEIDEMEMSFSRGFSHGWLDGCDHKMLVPATSSAKRGVKVGAVLGVVGNRVRVRLERPIRCGDGVTFGCDKGDENSQGGRIYEIVLAGKHVKVATTGMVELGFAHGQIHLDAISRTQTLWKTDDPQLTKKLRNSFRPNYMGRRTPVLIDASVAPGSPLKMRVTQAGGDPFEIQTEDIAEAAGKIPLDEVQVREQLSRLGDTEFELFDLKFEAAAPSWLPLSAFGRLRKRLVALLRERALARPPRQITIEPVLPRLRPPKGHDSSSLSPRLWVLCRQLKTLDAILGSECRERIDGVYVDFADIREYRLAVSRGREANVAIVLATPRIQKPDEMGVFRTMARYQPAGALVRNYSGLEFFQGEGFPCVVDFSLNVANEITFAFFHSRKVERITASYDLNREQLVDLAANINARSLEVVIHQRMPMFHMEHCVFCSLLSPGTNKHNCGRPCDYHEVRLRDRLGMEHPLTADVGCRNTLYNAIPQSGAEVVSELKRYGVANYRVELLDESPELAVQTVKLYRRLLDGEISGQQVWQALKASNRVGVTRGTLEESRNPLAIL